MKKIVSAMRGCAGVLALTVLTGTVCGAADSIAVKSRDGSCQVMVPGDWSPGELGGSAASADKQISLAISSPTMVNSFAELKQMTKSVYTSSKVTKDLATEFVMEGESITGKPDVYRVIQTGAGKFCIVEVIYESGGPQVARTIAQSLKAAQ